MARKKKQDAEDLELELELEPTEIDGSEDGDEESEEEVEEIEESEEAEVEASVDEDEEEVAKPKRKRRASKKAKAVAKADDESEESLEVEAVEEEPKAKPARKSKKAQKIEAVPVETVSTEAVPAGGQPAVAAATGVVAVPAPVESDAKAIEQIAALVKQWEQSNAALASQLEKLNHKIPSPTIKAATSWAPLARIAVGASAASVLLAILSLVFSHNVRQQVLQAATQPAPSAIVHKTESVRAERVSQSAPRTTPQDAALESLARKARQEQAELAMAVKKPRTIPAPVASKASRIQKRRK